MTFIRNISTVLTVTLGLANIACDNNVGCGEMAPQVTPALVSVGKDTVSLKWQNVGNWKFKVGISEDSIPDNDLHGTQGQIIENILDTFCVVRNLKPSTWHKVVVWTYGDSTAKACPTQSWPPLRFKTLE